MPRRGQGNYQFRLRPIDIRGKELGKEFTLNISEHHTQLQHIREQRRLEEEERRHGGMWGGGRGPMTGGDIIVNPGGGGYGEERGHSYAEEMGRMFEQAVESAEDRSRRPSASDLPEENIEHSTSNIQHRSDGVDRGRARLGLVGGQVAQTWPHKSSD